jgi:23S rRNA (guanosine2251-2'-O)-methyltransferase
MLIYGIHPVEEILVRAPTMGRRLYIAADLELSQFRKIKALVEEQGIPIVRSDARKLEEMARGGNHQKIILETGPYPYAELDELIAATADRSRACLLVLEQIQDAGNLGAILRSAATMGVDGVIIPRDRSAQVNETTIRASAGLAMSVPVAVVTNIARTLGALKEHGYWAVGAVLEDATDLWAMNFDFKCALVMGGEHQGIRPLVEKNCDFRVRIPMAATTESLNVASATAVILYEIRRQNHFKSL